MSRIFPNIFSLVIFYRVREFLKKQGKHSCFSILVGTYLTLCVANLFQKLLACFILFREEITILRI